MAATFDTLRTVKSLRGAGASEELAEAVTEALRESRDFDLAQLATKADLELRIAEVRSDLRVLEHRMTIKLGGMIGAAVVLIGAFLKLFPGGHP
jgi:hypothetical protein